MALLSSPLQPNPVSCPSPPDPGGHPGSPLGTHKCTSSGWLASGHGRRVSWASLPSLYGETIQGQDSLQMVLSAEPSVCLMGCGSLPDPPPVPQVTRDPAPQALLPGNPRLTPPTTLPVPNTQQQPQIWRLGCLCSPSAHNEMDLDHSSFVQFYGVFHRNAVKLGSGANITLCPCVCFHVQHWS